MKSDDDWEPAGSHDWAILRRPVANSRLDRRRFGRALGSSTSVEIDSSVDVENLSAVDVAPAIGVLSILFRGEFPRAGMSIDPRDRRHHKLEGKTPGWQHNEAS